MAQIFIDHSGHVDQRFGIMVTLIHALKACGLKKGVVTLCIGGGEATAVAIGTHSPL